MKKQMKKHIRTELTFIFITLLAAQITFAFLSPRFTAPSYEGRIYATTGVKHKQEDLHKLNEAAHYFGQTIIGWLKFPSFMPDLRKVVELPASAILSAHMQERQNLIYTLSSPEPVSKETLVAVKDFVQSKIDEYNASSQTQFVMTNLDYETVTLQKSYLFGAAVTLLFSLVIGVGLIFVRRELL
jgi:hypothetical protein